MSGNRNEKIQDFDREGNKILKNDPDKSDPDKRISHVNVDESDKKSTQHVNTSNPEPIIQVQKPPMGLDNPSIGLDNPLTSLGNPLMRSSSLSIGLGNPLISSGNPSNPLTVPSNSNSLFRQKPPLFR